MSDNKQSKLGSFLEAWWQPFIGFFISVWVWNWIVWPGIEAGWIDPTSGIMVNGIFFVASFIRSYAIRRISVRYGAALWAWWNAIIVWYNRTSINILLKGDWK